MIWQPLLFSSALLKVIVNIYNLISCWKLWKGTWKQFHVFVSSLFISNRNKCCSLYLVQTQIQIWTKQNFQRTHVLEKIQSVKIIENLAETAKRARCADCKSTVSALLIRTCFFSMSEVAHRLSAGTFVVQRLKVQNLYP